MPNGSHCLQRSRKIWTPDTGEMGKNGDQIQRIVKCPAEIFLVLYWRDIDDSVFEQLEKFVQLKAHFENRKLWYGIIGGNDSARLIEAYPLRFPRKHRRKLP